MIKSEDDVMADAVFDHQPHAAGFTAGKIIQKTSTQFDLMYTVSIALKEATS